MPASTTLVTGSTGNVGREVVRDLQRRGAPVVAAVLNERDAAEAPPGVPTVTFDFGRAETFALTEAGHLNMAYTLTGSETLDYYEVADIFTMVEGRRICYTRPTPAAYAARQKELGVPDEFIRVMRSLYWTVRLGVGAKVTPELGELLGRPPITMAQYGRDFRPRFAAAPAAERAGATPLPRKARTNLLRPVIELLK